MDEEQVKLLVSNCVNLAYLRGINRSENPKLEEDAIAPIMALIASNKPDLSNIQDWVDKGLDPTNTNKDVPYRCLQMINDELKNLSEEDDE
jgi:type II secretory pathway component PulK